MERASMIQDEHIQTLMELELSLLQAKTYLALAKLGKADVKTIAKASNMARQDIYRIMPTLQKRGLAKKIIAKPTMYKATPIKEGLSILLQNRKTEYAELQKKTSSLINNFHENNAEIALQEENTQFIITSEMTLLRKMLKKLIQKAQTSIDIAIPLKVFQLTLFQHEHFKRAKKGVKIRVIIQKVEGDQLSRKPQALAKSFFEIKCLYNPAPFGMHIFDKKEVTLCISEPDGVPCLWSNNPNIVKLATNYFDDMWNKAHENLDPDQKQIRALHANLKQPQTQVSS